MLYLFTKDGKVTHAFESDEHPQTLVDRFFKESKYAAEVAMGWKAHKETIEIRARRFKALYADALAAVDTPDARYQWTLKEWGSDFLKWIEFHGLMTSHDPIHQESYEG